MAIKLEKVVEHYYESLEEGKILGRKCPVCGNVEFPPVYACNKCGNSSKPEYKNLGKYAYCEVELEEGTHLNAVVRGINKKKRQELMDKLPEVYCHAAIFEREQGFKTVVFDLDDGQ